MEKSNNTYVNFPITSIGIECKVYLVVVSNQGDYCGIDFDGISNIMACILIGHSESVSPNWNCQYSDLNSDGKGLFQMLTRLHSDCDIKILVR